jgi:DNA polymerase
MTSIMTHPDHSTIEQTRETLRALRWVLSGHAMSGLQEWHRASRSPVFAAEPVGTDTRSEDPAQGLMLAREELGDCRRCRLHTSRTQIVFGDGSAAARLVFVGEAPGFEEDRQGRPFVGRAGQLLDKMIQALGLKRSDVYICNVIKCRPPQNRNPQADEVEACAPFLLQQLEAIQPQVICILGTYAAQTLLQTRRPISQLRGKIESWRGVPAVATFHPAYLLRNAGQKASAWQDCRLILQLLRGESPTGSPA